MCATADSMTQIFVSSDALDRVHTCVRCAQLIDMSFNTAPVPVATVVTAAGTSEHVHTLPRDAYTQGIHDAAGTCLPCHDRLDIRSALSLYVASMNAESDQELIGDCKHACISEIVWCILCVAGIC